MAAKYAIVLTLISFCSPCVAAEWTREIQEKLVNVRSVTFLVTVNDTWDPNGCIATVKTPPLKPNVKYNHTEQIHVGSCDHGPLDFRVSSLNDSVNAMTVDLVFHSSVVEDADPPACSIGWNGTYLVPRASNIPDQSLLPGCMTGDSREGYHMTYYWFHILEWSF
ncbi:uncharacterized protein LOC110454209 [Mizuhopecten yessoensis]|uniref:uncharacterized protein LOC110454209 n=1 Tax=Mizuhopecten yessoensis TaxID=6573 RepID=UPI000B45ABB6|nr:uncharacterized protein LOC110454209 [Mizuhopecten yessoensis]